MNLRDVEGDLVLTLERLERVTQQSMQTLTRQVTHSEAVPNILLTHLLTAIAERNWTEASNIIGESLGEEGNVQLEKIKDFVAPVQLRPQEKALNTKPEQVVPQANKSPAPSNPQPQQKAPPSKGFFGKLLPFMNKKKEEGNFTPMYLPTEEQKYYFDKQLGKYVFEGQEIVQEVAPPPPPKRQQLKKQEVAPALNPRSQMDSMIAPPSVNLRRGKKGGKEKQEIIKQPIVLVRQEEEEVITFEVLRTKLLSFFETVNNMELVPEVKSTQVPMEYLEQNQSDEQLTTEVFDLMKQSYEMLLRTHEWGPFSYSAPSQIVLSESNNQIQELEALRKTISALELQISENSSKFLNYSELDLQRKASLDQKDSALKFQHKQLKEQQQLLKQTGEELQQFRSKYQAQLREYSQLQEQMVEKEEFSRKLTFSGDEIEKLQKMNRQKDNIIKLLQENEGVFRQSIESFIRQQKLVTAIDGCLEEENSLLERIRSKQEKLLTNTLEDQIDTHPTFVSSRGFLEMVDLFDKIASHSHSTLNTVSASNECLNGENLALKNRLESQRSQYQSKVSNLKNIITKQKATLDSFKIDSNDSCEKLETLKREKTKLQKEIERIKHDASFGKGLLEQSNNKYVLVSKKSENQTMQINSLASEIEGLRSANLELETRSNELGELLVEMEREKEALDDQISGMRERLEEVDQVSEELRQSREEGIRLSGLVGGLENQVRELEEELRVKKEEIEGVMQQVSESTELAQALDKQLDEKSELVQHVQSHLQQQRTINTSMREQIELKSNELTSLRNTFQSIRSQNEQLERRVIAQLEEIESLQTQRSQLDQVLVSLQQQLESEKSQKAEIQIRLRESEGKEGLNSEIQQKISDYQELIKQLGNNLSELQNMNSMERSTNLTLTKENLLLKKELIVTQEQMGIYESTSSSLKETITNLHAEKEEIEGSISELASELESRESAQKALSERVGTLEEEKKALNVELSEREQLINALQEEIQQLQSEVEKLSSQSIESNTQIRTLSTRIQQLQSLPTPDLSGPIKEFQELKEKIEEQKFQIQQTKDYYLGKIEDLEQRIGELLEEKSINTSSIAEINNKYQIEIQNERESKDIVINQLRLGKKELEATIVELTEANSKSQKEVEELLELVDSTNQEKESQKALDTNLTEEINKRQDTITQMHKELEAGKLMVYELNEFIRSMKEREASMEAKIKELEMATQSPKQTEIKKLNQKIQNLSLENQELLKEKIALLRDNETLVGELAEASKPKPQPAPQIEQKPAPIPKPQSPPISVTNTKQKQPIDLTKSLPIPPTASLPNPPSVGVAPKPPSQKRSGLMSALSSIFLTNQEQNK